MLHLPYFTPELPYYYLHSSEIVDILKLKNFFQVLPVSLTKTLAIIVDVFANELNLESKIESSLVLQNLNLFAE